MEDAARASGMPYATAAGMRGIHHWVLALGLGVGACAPTEPRELPLAAPRDGAARTVVEVLPPPPLGEGIFPCSECHGDMDPDFTRRELAMHDEIVLRHGDHERWCFDCHDPGDRDKLRLASGATVAMADSYRLCAQCHGDKHRDWRIGIHGKRIGSWNGARQAVQCASCHDAHAPRFEALAPLPPPPRPHLQVKR